MKRYLAGEILATRLASLNIAIQAENANFTPPQGVYLSEMLLNLDPAHIKHKGGQVNTYSGLWQVLVHAKKGDTRKAGGTVIDQVTALYPIAWSGTKSGATVTIRSVKIDAGFADGDRFVYPITFGVVAIGL